MTITRWQYLQDLYFNVVELAPAERVAYLDRECDGDVEIRRELDSLLEYEETVGDFLLNTAVGGDGILESLSTTLDSDDAPDDDEEPVKTFIGTRVNSRYVVTDYVGSGGMGHVYRATHLITNTPVAIKRLRRQFRDSAQFRERFIAEARRTIGLSHDNVNRVLDVIEEHGEVFVIMEFVEGTTLAAGLGRAFDLDRFLDIAIQCASALVAAHERGVAHLDIKPENIMLRAGSGKVQVCDFGLGREMPRAGEQGALHWIFGGTPAYMAPEVLESNHFDTRADVFSLGLVFYEMLTATHPFRTGDVGTTTNNILTQTAPPLSSPDRKIPRRLRTLVERMLLKDPHERPDSSNALRELESIHRLRRFLPDAVKVGVETVRRQPWATAAAAILIVVAITAIGLRPASEIKLLALPFEDSTDIRYAQALEQNMAARLSEIPGVQVQVGPQSQSQAGTQSEFKPNMTLQGSFHYSESGDRIVVFYTLKPQGEKTVTRSLDLAKTSVSSVQDHVIRAVSDALERMVNPARQKKLVQAGTVNTEALDRYNDAQDPLREYHDPESTDQAIALLKQALGLDRDFSAARASLAEAYWMKYQHTEDKEWLNRAIDECRVAYNSYSKERAAAHICMGTSQQEDGKYVDAEAAFREAIRLEPGRADAYRGLALALESQKKYDEAEKTYRRAIELDKSYWASYSWLGKFFYEQDQYLDAIEQYQSARKYASTENVRVLYSLSAPYIRLGKYDRASEILMDALQIKPSMQAYNNLGYISLAQERYDEAIKWFEMSDALGGEYRVTGNLARAYGLKGQPDQAQKLFKKAIREAREHLKANPDDSKKVHMALALYYGMLKDRENALSNLESADAQNAHDLMFAALIYTRLEDTKNALDQLDKASQGKHGLTAVELQAIPELKTLRNTDVYKRITAKVATAP